MSGTTERWIKRVLTVAGAVAVIAFTADAFTQPQAGRGQRHGKGQRAGCLQQDGQQSCPLGLGGGGRRGPSVEELDVDGDGVLSLEETSALPRMTPEHFAEIDTDGSGTLSSDEFPAHRGMGGQHGSRLRATDTNGDGQITWEEASALPRMTEEHFGMLDSNGDGVIAADEMPTGAQGRRGPRIAQADANGDGLITWDEASTCPNMTEEHFNDLDQNDDGSLDASELPVGQGSGQRCVGAGAGAACPRVADGTGDGAGAARGNGARGRGHGRGLGGK
jgi:hypothetical protein